MKFQRLTPYAAGPSISELVTLFEARLRGAMFWGRFLFRTFYCEFAESVGGFGVFGGASSGFCCDLVEMFGRHRAELEARRP